MSIECLPKDFALDTETGMCPDRVVKTVLIQICNVEATTEDEVKLYLGEDCYQQFLESFGVNDPKDKDPDGNKIGHLTCRIYNNKWESKPLIAAIIAHGYNWVDARKISEIPKMGWSCVMDDKQAYQIRLRNAKGCLLTITDDYLKILGHSMSEATAMVQHEYPEWWPAGADTKMNIPKSLYNVWYTFSEDNPRYRLFLDYARRDAYSQAKLSKWMDIHGYHLRLTSASNGLALALGCTYYTITDMSEMTNYIRRTVERKFRERHPPLDRREQDILEDSMLGGFTYGAPNVEDRIWGVFCHIDYKSSYPYEYMYGLLPKACPDGKPCHVYAKGTPEYDRVFADHKYKCVWVLVSFKFRLRPNRMPCISAESCYNRATECDFHSQKSKKMIAGEVRGKLFSLELYEEIKRHYEVSCEDIPEVWVAPGKIGEFAKFIELCFGNKEKPELKGTLERNIWKLFMNGGVHGKTITKTHRTRIEFPDNVKMTIGKDEAEPSEPQYCALIGFTAMQNARARLLKHCRMLLDAGYRIHMCDTDSIVVEATEAQVREVLGDWIVDDSLKGADAIKNLGKFEFETNEDMLKRIYKKKDGVWMYRKEQIRVEFDGLSCGGLKEYAEFDESLGVCELRKSAFKGMQDDVQLEILGNTDMSMGKTIQWTQNQKFWNGYAYELKPIEKTVVVGDIYYSEPVKIKRKTDYIAI